MEFVTLNTSLREQNHHQFKKADDASQINIIQSTVNIEYILIIKFLVKYNTSADGALSGDMAG